ncbi:hypothetical protein H0H81_011783 [Sphagnurus paluster]|uniref:Uncharacterized protein n=1 Tax=Sphagnurus paluster TaxID=117069 RepID=A0A9P7FQW1_9AGAR|nr:hypothetical protein H0H81_011783 [Sphagnurus paluster]
MSSTASPFLDDIFYPLPHPGPTFLATVSDLAIWRVFVDDVDRFSVLLASCTAVQKLRLYISNTFTDPADEIFRALKTLCTISSAPALKSLTLVFHTGDPPVSLSLIANFSNLVDTWRGIEGRQGLAYGGEYQINLFLVTKYYINKNVANAAEAVRVRFGVSDGVARIAGRALDHTFGLPIYVGIWKSADVLAMKSIRELWQEVGRGDGFVELTG